MQLMTKELEKRFEEVGNQDNVKDLIVVAKYFNPMGSATWYAIEYYPEDKIFFGYASLFGDHNDEWGDFSLTELEELKLPMGMTIERDLYTPEQPISAYKISSLIKETK